MYVHKLQFLKGSLVILHTMTITGRMGLGKVRRYLMNLQPPMEQFTTLESLCLETIKKNLPKETQRHLEDVNDLCIPEVMKMKLYGVEENYTVIEYQNTLWPNHN